MGEVVAQFRHQLVALVLDLVALVVVAADIGVSTPQEVPIILSRVTLEVNILEIPMPVVLLPRLEGVVHLDGVEMQL
ncbi:hypothetical protein PHIN9_13260 [Polynucleobacter sp. HIN9]|nr:hypothetical protein PHIN9_13260 [Polynucleobacter sp. HIN9]